MFPRCVCAVKTLLRPDESRRALHVLAVSAVASREMALLVRLATVMDDWGVSRGASDEWHLVHAGAQVAASWSPNSTCLAMGARFRC